MITTIRKTDYTIRVKNNLLKKGDLLYFTSKRISGKGITQPYFRFDYAYKNDEQARMLKLTSEQLKLFIERGLI